MNEPNTVLSRTVKYQLVPSNKGTRETLIAILVFGLSEQLPLIHKQFPLQPEPLLQALHEGLISNPVLAQFTGVETIDNLCNIGHSTGYELSYDVIGILISSAIVALTSNIWTKG